MKITILFPILWVVFTFIGFVQTIWLPHSLGWQKLRGWRLFGKTQPPPLQYGDYNHYRQGGSYSYYPWPYQCGKLPAYSRPVVYAPSNANALYYGYPALQRTAISKPIAVKPAGSPLLYYAPNEPHQRPVQWQLQQLPGTGAVALRNNLKRLQSVDFDSVSLKVQSELLQQQQQKKKQRPLVIAHNGIFILNGGGAGAQDLLINANADKTLGSSTESIQQLTV